MKHAAAGVGLGAVLLAACGAPRTIASEPEQSPRKVAAEPAPQTSSPELAWVAAARGLAPPSGLEVERIARVELLRVAAQKIAGQAPDWVLTERSRVLVALGLAPEGFDLKAAIVDSLEAMLVGLYDPDARRVLVVDDVSPGLAESTRWHELGHAIVDHHFGLAERFQYRAGESDLVAALAALAEGDATSLGLDLDSERSGRSRESLVAMFLERTGARYESDAVPGVVRCLLAAPYREGLGFVEALRARGGWAAVNAAWRDPPTTTEQVLHPDRYERREPAVQPPGGAPPGNACREILHDTLGASALGCFFAEWLGDAEAAIDAAGWGGDRVATFDCPGGSWVELALAGDDTAALERMRDALRAGVSANRCLDPSWDASLSSATSVRVLLPPGQRCATLAALPH
jgi:hypothetical protein